MLLCKNIIASAYLTKEVENYSWKNNIFFEIIPYIIRIRVIKILRYSSSETRVFQFLLRSNEGDCQSHFDHARHFEVAGNTTSQFFVFDKEIVLKKWLIANKIPEVVMPCSLVLKFHAV